MIAHSPQDGVDFLVGFAGQESFDFFRRLAQL